MSSFARKARRHRQRQMERAAISIACDIRGCICRPDVDHYHADGMRQVAVAHDDWCPAADSGSMLIVGRGHTQTPEEFAKDIVTVLRAVR